MLRLFYHLFLLLIRFSGIAFVLRKLVLKNKISILMYHNPRPAVFEKHLKFLSKRFHLISMNEFSQVLYKKDAPAIPDYALVITIDDGWKENYHLLPVIMKYKFRPLIFLASHIVNSERHFWWTESSPEAMGHLKRLPNHKRLEAMQQRFQFYPEKEFPGKRQALSGEEIKEMQPWVDFGLHTCFHPVLSQCSTAQKREEIGNGKTTLEKMLEQPIEHFAYPNGDYDRESIEILKACGIKTARTTDAGFNSRHSDPYTLKITGVSDTGSVNKLAAEMTGIPLYLQHLFFSRSLNGRKNRHSR